jgi:hypothetical protein
MKDARSESLSNLPVKASDSAPLILMTPMPPCPGGVAIADIVLNSERSMGGQQNVEREEGILEEDRSDIRREGPSLVSSALRLRSQF